MISRKRSIESHLLRRPAHADVFEIGTSPTFLFVLFGGSGVDEDEYERRSRTVIPVFERVLDPLRSGPSSFVFVHVTAPYDVPFNRFATEPAAARIWNEHVTAELLQPWPELPYFVSGFSGGVALALNGLQNDPRCIGAAGFGADAIPSRFVCPEHWAERLRLYVAPDDRVCNHPANRRLADALVDGERAELIELRSGRHLLADYATPDGLGDAIRTASDIACGRTETV